MHAFEGVQVRGQRSVVRSTRNIQELLHVETTQRCVSKCNISSIGFLRSTACDESPCHYVVSVHYGILQLRCAAEHHELRESERNQTHHCICRDCSSRNCQSEKVACTYNNLGVENAKKKTC